MSTSVVLCNGNANLLINSFNSETNQTGYTGLKAVMET